MPSYRIAEAVSAHYLHSVVRSALVFSAYLQECIEFIEQEWNGWGVGEQREIHHISDSLFGFDNDM